LLAARRRYPARVTTKYDAAVAELYHAPLDAFVAERKRLAKELGAAGDKSGAAMLAKLTRPSVSAWATNQLYARAREPFDELFASAAKLREGDLEAGSEHRSLTAKLVARAAEILKEAGHGASEGTLRRVSANLAALAAAGSFDPDPRGALSHDRDPPGFDVLAFGASPGETNASTHAAASKHTTTKARAEGAAPLHHHGTADADGARHEREAAARAKAEAARAKAEAEAERRRAAEEQARVRSERRRLESALRAVKADVEHLTHERKRLQGELKETETELERALTSERDLDERLGKLSDAH
jgi:hypothetical protein